MLGEEGAGGRGEGRGGEAKQGGLQEEKNKGIIVWTVLLYVHIYCSYLTLRDIYYLIFEEGGGKRRKNKKEKGEKKKEFHQVM